MSNKTKNILLVVLGLAVIGGLLHCYIPSLLYPSEITAYTTNLQEKSQPLLTIKKTVNGFIWSSNDNARLKHYVVDFYDTYKNRPVKSSLFVNQDGPGFIVIRHESKRGGHHDGGDNDALLTPNVSEYKSDENGQLKLLSGSVKPFP